MILIPSRSELAQQLEGEMGFKIVTEGANNKNQSSRSHPQASILV
jgi:hypothetical protein